MSTHVDEGIIRMKRYIKRGIINLARRVGRDVAPQAAPAARPAGFTDQDCEIISACEAYTLTGPERLFNLIEAVRHVERHGISGDIVECGVWRGGSMMAVAMTLLRLGNSNRHLHLLDTFEGMPAPDHDRDVSLQGKSAVPEWEGQKNADGTGSTWCYASLDEVRAALDSTGYPSSQLHFVKGLVEDTLPEAAPERISILRLDTDFYESTRHELNHLFPLLEHGGVLILDDYDYWGGARQAVDEYLAEHEIRLLLGRIGGGGRIGVKC